jgi:hypothetical protein
MASEDKEGTPAAAKIHEIKISSGLYFLPLVGGQTTVTLAD